MKTTKNLLTLALVFIAVTLFAQQPGIQYFRPWDKTGINIFEAPKGGDQPAYEGLSVRIGGSFTQDYQSLTHENNPGAAKNYLWGVNVSEDPNSAKLSGFNLAMANLNFDFQIEDGIRVCLENYMSARHHNEFWVKGGYIQIDKLSMFGSPDWFTNNFRVKIGHFQPNFGDQQFRRTDGGNAMFNPFAENFILDAFTTEIGGEVYAFPGKGLMLMVGMSSGLINGNVENPPSTPVGSNKEATKRNPSIFFKAAYDKQFTDDLRFRLSASMYNNSSISANTLYSGDRTGSHYFMMLEPTTGTYLANKDSGRFNAGMRNRINAIMINPFLKFKGLELFGSYETVKGGAYSETDDRKWNQLAVEGLYRFAANEQLYIGGRYISAKGRPQGAAFTQDVTINRTAFVAGWFPTKNLLLKGEIVNQKYLDFPASDIKSEGKFNGFMVEAVIGF
ncbi:MAG: hypothetical protein IPN74_06770 [Haliscomenobacter sp.]|nr:hypothetical protein [Haliscomenobacter sp.]MBK8878250.1 hypothetical protein [Haliscomenobacter sp.]